MLQGFLSTRHDSLILTMETSFTEHASVAYFMHLLPLHCSMMPWLYTLGREERRGLSHSALDFCPLLLSVRETALEDLPPCLPTDD